MKNTYFVAIVLVLVSAAVFVSLSTSQTQSQDLARALFPAPGGDRVQRGEYLVKIMGCNDCHTPWKMGPQGPEPDMTRMLSGHPEQIGPLPAVRASEPYVSLGFATNTAYSGPWGVSYAFNLTPDQNTGLGIWTEEMFIQTIRTGRHMGVSRPINPPMPWPAYRHATDEDLKSVYAYLRTIKPIVNHVPEYVAPGDSN